MKHTKNWFFALLILVGGLQLGTLTGCVGYVGDPGGGVYYGGGPWFGGDVIVGGGRGWYGHGGGGYAHPGGFHHR
jgi:hypothetical protein